MVQHDDIPQERMDDCFSIILEAGVTQSIDTIKTIARQSGGLFNFLLRVEISNEVYFFKQYLDGVKNETYDVPEIPASERAALAYDVQQLALDSIDSFLGPMVPQILHFARQRNAFLMREAIGGRGKPLIDYLCVGIVPNAFYSLLPKTLASLHQLSYRKYSVDTPFANTLFRDFKLGLQYDGITDYLDKNEALAVLQCKSDYQTKRYCITHGDINSRNILINQTEVGVIDFEQSHLGTPAYDLAYILSEAVISFECFDYSFTIKEMLIKFLDSYFDVFQAEDRLTVESELTQHIAIQILYRFWGPSRDSWTFYVNDESKARIISRYRRLLLLDEPISQVFR